jgi:hypothetical protein
MGQRFTHFVAIDVFGLQIFRCRSGVFLVPNDFALSLVGCIVDFGERMVSHKVVYEDCAGTGVKEGCLKGAAIVILKVNLGLRRLNSTNRKPQ